MPNTISRVLSDDTLNRIIQIESAGNPNARAQTSSAAGLGQFINSTWLATVQKHKPQLLRENTRDQVARMRVGDDTTALQLEMLARFTEDNAALLGAGCTDGDLYLAHFLGIGDARKLFRADPGSPAAHHVTAAAVRANKSILSGKTCGQVRAWAQASMEQRWVKGGKKDWVKKYAGRPAILPDPPDIRKPKPPTQVAGRDDIKPPVAVQPKRAGFFGLLALVWASITSFFADAHPLITVAIIAAPILIGIGAWWFFFRKKG